MDNLNRQRNLGFFFDQAIARAPDKVAIIDLFGGRSAARPTGSSMRGWMRVARMLARLGVRAGERVAMLVGNRTEFIEFFFGSMRAGAIPLPLNTRLAAGTLDAHHRRCRMRAGDRRPFEPSRCSLDRARLCRCGNGCCSISARRAFSSFEDEMAKPAPPVEPPAIADDAQAFQPYTSGSTGRPKGAIMTHRGMLWYVAYNQRYWPSARERPRARRAAAVSQERLARHGEADALCRRLLRADAGLRAARLSRSAGQVQMHLFARRRGGVHDVSSASRLSRTLDLSALRGMTIGSAVVTPELLDAVERALPHVKVSESYGLTEGGSPLRAPIDGRPVPRGSPGVPAPEIELRLVDASGSDAEEGELLIRCPYVCLGYYNEPEITRAKAHRRLAAHGRYLLQGQGRLLLFPQPGRRHVQLRRREYLSEGSREPAVRASRRGECGGGAGAASGEGFRAGRHGDGARGLDRHCGRAQGLLPGRGPAYSHPRFIDIVAALPLNGAGKIDRGVVQARLNAAYAATSGSTA